MLAPRFEARHKLRMKWLTPYVAGLVLLGGASPALARSFAIGGLSISEAEILDARAQPDISGMASVMISLDDSASQKLAKLTADNIGKVLAITMDGKVLVEPLVQAAITDGQIMISGTFTVKDAEMLAKQISGKEPLPDSLDETNPL
jgi:preprotein translocase subunit SecD